MAKKQKPTKGATEHMVQAAIVKYLDWSLAGDCDYFAIGNNPRNPIDGANQKKRGMRAGVGDLCVFGHRGAGEVFVGFLEVKTATGRQAPKQKEWQERCEECGAGYAIVRSVEDVRETLEEWGLL